MLKVSFASKSLPDELGDQARFKLWGELGNDVFCRMGFERAEDRPFDVTLEYLAIGAVGLGHFDGTITRVERSARDIAADANDDLCFGINLAPAPVKVSQAGQDYLLEEGHACLMLHTEPFEVRVREVTISRAGPQPRFKILACRFVLETREHSEIKVSLR